MTISSGFSSTGFTFFFSGSLTVSGSSFAISSGRPSRRVGSGGKSGSTLIRSEPRIPLRVGSTWAGGITFSFSGTLTGFRFEHRHFFWTTFSDGRLRRQLRVKHGCRNSSYYRCDRWSGDSTAFSAFRALSQEGWLHRLFPVHLGRIIGLTGFFDRDLTLEPLPTGLWRPPLKCVCLNPVLTNCWFTDHGFRRSDRFLLDLGHFGLRRSFLAENRRLQLRTAPGHHPLKGYPQYQKPKTLHVHFWLTFHPRKTNLALKETCGALGDSNCTRQGAFFGFFVSQYDPLPYTQLI